MSTQSRNINLDRIQRIHMIGVGGIGMSALARHFLAEKKSVSGSDRALTPVTQALEQEGVQIFGEQSAANITSDIELVVYTEAITEGSEGYAELAAARAQKIPTINLFQADGLAFNPYYLIAVAGTHGKTTTTAMLTDIFEANGKDPTAVIGSLRAKTGSNYRAGKSKYAIVEACEYKRDFLHLRPDVLIITNLEHEHVDYYENLASVQAAFSELVSQVNEGGVVVTDPQQPHIAPILEGCNATVIDYTKYVDLQLSLKQPGMHNRLNAAAALAVATHEKLDQLASRQALSDFAGTWRRFEFKGHCQGAPVHDDYAHHPTEIAATIDGARELYPDRRLVVVFQPHTYSRTHALFDRFAKALGKADVVHLLPIYAAREENESGVSSRELAVKTLEYTSAVQHHDSIDAVIESVRTSLTDQDALIVLGAGTVSQVATALVK